MMATRAGPGQIWVSDYTTVALREVDLGPVDAVKSGFQHYVGFNGRASRSEYWWWYLFAVIVAVVAAIADSSGVLAGLIGLGLFLPGLAVGFRRLHDSGRSAWWLLIAIVPLIGILVLLVFLVSAGDALPNKYGPPVGSSLHGFPDNAEASPRSPGAEPTDQTRKLSELREAGALTQEEFETKKAELLSRM